MQSIAGVIVVVVFGLILLGAIYHRHPELRKTVVFFGSSVGVAAAAIGAFFTFVELQDSTEQQRQAVRLRRQSLAFSYMREFQEIPEKAQLRSSMNDLSGKPPEEVQSFFKNHPDEGIRLANMLSFFEELAVAIRVGYADEPTLCAFLDEPVVRYFTTLEDWVRYYRDEEAAPAYLVNLEWLRDRWRGGCPELEDRGVLGNLGE